MNISIIPIFTLVRNLNEESRAWVVRSYSIENNVVPQNIGHILVEILILLVIRPTSPASPKRITRGDFFRCGTGSRVVPDRSLDPAFVRGGNGMVPVVRRVWSISGVGSWNTTGRGVRRRMPGTGSSRPRRPLISKYYEISS